MFEKQDALTFRLCRFSSNGQLEDKSSFQVDPIGCSLADMSLLSIGECVFLVTKFGSFCAKYDDLLGGVLIPVMTDEKISVFTHNALLYHVEEQSGRVQFAKLEVESMTRQARLISVGSGYKPNSDNTLVLQESDANYSGPNATKIFRSKIFLSGTKIFSNRTLLHFLSYFEFRSIFSSHKSPDWCWTGKFVAGHFLPPSLRAFCPVFLNGPNSTRFPFKFRQMSPKSECASSLSNILVKGSVNCVFCRV